MVNMTSFLGRKNRHKFRVVLRVEELSSVPFVNGVLFAKVRLLGGGTFTSYSVRKNIENNKVRWDSEFQFETKMTSNCSNAVLDPTFLRISIRKETKGGKSYLKVGYATINLAQFAASASGTTRRYLLEAYNQKKRQDNSMLQVNITMTIIMGDVCFQMPADSDGKGLPLQGDVDTASSVEADSEENDHSGAAVTATAAASGSGASGAGNGACPSTTSPVSVPPVTLWDGVGNLVGHSDAPGAAATLDDLDALSDSSGRGSGKHHLRHVSDGGDFSSSPGLLSSENGFDMTGPVPAGAGPGAVVMGPIRGHARAHSSVSAVSTSGVATGPASSSGARTHSRQSSLESCHINRYPSNSSGLNDRSLDRKWDRPCMDLGINRRFKANETSSIKEHRMLSTRVDNDELVSQLLSSTTPEEGPNPKGNLQLTVAKDGTASVVSVSSRNSSIIPGTQADVLSVDR